MVPKEEDFKNDHVKVFLRLRIYTGVFGLGLEGWTLHRMAPACTIGKREAGASAPFIYTTSPLSERFSLSTLFPSHALSLPTRP